MAADSTQAWAFDTANMLPVEELVALRYTVAVLCLLSMEGINQSGTSIITEQFFTNLLCLIRNYLQEHN